MPGPVAGAAVRALGVGFLLAGVATAQPPMPAAVMGRSSNPGAAVAQPAPVAGIAPAMTAAPGADPSTGLASTGARPGAAAPAGVQYLLGSGEAAALSRATWAALVDYVTRALAAPQRQGVVLDAGSTLAAPRFASCGAKPAAVVTDIDESAILNVGWLGEDAAAGGRPFSATRWRRWEDGGVDRVAPTPGAVEAVARLRALNVAVVFTSNRDADAAGPTTRALAAAGLGQAEPGRSLFLHAPGVRGKDANRALVASRYCVLAMLGDQLGDFSDLFDADATPAQRRAATAVPAIADLWGEGWFLMPNPLYGAALRGTLDEVVPGGQRWIDPGPVASPSAQPPAPPEPGSSR